MTRSFASLGPMGAIFATHDWSTCALGPPEQWPVQLRGYVDMMLRMATGAIIFWGPDQIQLYNIHYSVIMGPRHPRYLGAPYRECWPDTYETIYPMMRRVLDGGETIEVTNALIPVTRYGFTEETYFTFSFVPLRGDHDAIEGFIQFITETSQTVLAERRLATLRALAPRVEQTSDVLLDAAEAMRANLLDIAFVAIYLGEQPTLVGVDRVPAIITDVAIRVAATGMAEQIDLGGWTPVTHWPEPIKAALVLPLRRTDDDPISGSIVLGISPRLTFDQPYREFFEAVARAFASNLAFEREARVKARLALELQQRADALAELDHAKTLFFSNVSHEFRTPLTLIHGPLEDALADPDEPLGTQQRERLLLVQRSATRLMKLVNTLLDFSRIEAGRTRAELEPVDLAVLTAGLAGTFRSLVERAGLRLEISCPPVSRPVWVDPEMWEKIVLNLLSNAFKFTFDGAIAVRLVEQGDTVELSVADTGTGIPAHELPKLFDRFHRVEGAKGRSFEGSGIGLALVQELVKMLGGAILVESEVGRGTTFTVALSTVAKGAPAELYTRPVEFAAPFVHEAEGWIAQHDMPPAAPAVTSARILLADDNGDMRDYVRRLLEPAYDVVAVASGTEVLAELARRVPDLILTDVMMPGVDGFGVLDHVKSNPETALVPVILLSARAGEEARVEGLAAGADDYLVKPFAAKELLAHVAVRLEVAAAQKRMNAELDGRVKERTAQLREANHELEAFSYSVSHDLRAPLRHILGFAQLLERSAQGKLDAKATGYLKTIADAAERGGRLVDDLLAFSRMSKAEMRSVSIDLERIVAEIRTELAPDYAGRDVVFTVGELPHLRGDPALIRMVMKNLISNALKYTRDVPRAVIEIGGTQSDVADEVWVTDNGVGFDMRYVGKLFGVFQRLHTNEQFEGNGIGLALVRRIIHRHGGTTAARGEVGKGATISFTLPRNVR